MKKLALSLVIALSASSAWATQTTLSNSYLSVLIDDSNCKIQVTVTDGGRVWTQPNMSSVACSSLSGNGTTATWSYTKTDYMTTASLVTATVSGNTLSITISGSPTQAYSGGAYPLWSWQYPQYFYSGSGDKIIFPTGEGMSVPATDTTALPPDNFITFYTGYYTPIPMVGVVGTTGGYQMIVETAMDAGFHMRSNGGYLAPQINWVPEKGYTGYDRKIKYYFGGASFDHVDMATNMRAWLVSEGLFKTIQEKRDEFSDPTKYDKLYGAGMYYNTSGSEEDTDSTLASNAGLDYMIISPSDYTTNPGDQWSTTTRDNVRARGHLTGSYHIYQDSWDPATGPAAQCYHQGGYNPGTSTYSGYGYVKLNGFSAPSTSSNKTYWKSGYNSSACGGTGYEVSRRFIYEALQSDTSNRMMKFMVNKMVTDAKLDVVMVDTEQANALVEDYDPAHLMTRRDDASYRRLIAQYHKNNGLIYGTEGGQWWGIPDVDFLDGTWTLTNTPGYSSSPGTNQTNSQTYQTAYTYRIPLFQLIYHDQVFSWNRWDGDRFEQFAYFDLTEMNKKKLWFKLYGMMPLLRDTSAAEDYVNDVLPAVKSVYDVSSLVTAEQMTNHEFLNASRSQQRTTWSNGITITVDFDAGTTTVFIPDPPGSGIPGVLGGKISGGKIN